MRTPTQSRELPARQLASYHLAGHTVLGATPRALVLVLPGSEGVQMTTDDDRQAGIAVVRAEDDTDDGSFADLDAMDGKLPADPEQVVEAIAGYVRESLTASETSLLDPATAGTVVRFAA